MDVSSGEPLCPNISVELTCVATRVAFLDWRINNSDIVDFNAGDSPSPTGMIFTPYTVFLDVVNLISMTSNANITSRLVVNLSDLMIGDHISCSHLGLNDSVTISYTLRGNYT